MHSTRNNAPPRFAPFLASDPCRYANASRRRKEEPNLGGVTRVVLALGILTAFMMAPAVAQDDAALRQEIRATYSFSPHELTSQQISEKSGVLDAFWARAKARKDVYLPVLRSELARADTRPFFLYDGSMLLLSLSDTPSDRRVALKAIARCDLRDVQHTEYFRQVHRLATLGEDTTEAALHILGEPKFTAFIPQHALTLGQDYALVYMVLPVDPARWLALALSRLAAETDPTAQKSLLLLAWYAQTREADAAILALAAATDKPAASREYARGLLARNSNAGLLATVMALFRSEKSLRAQRRELMKRVSDEALIELDQKTAQLAAKRK